MKTPLTLLLLAGTLTCPLKADTIELKSGVKYQGSIISEDAESYLVKIRYTATISDERRIPKKDIRNIIKAPKDSADFKKIQSFLPTPNKTTKEVYSERIAFCTNFLKKYPKSTHRKEVEKIIETLNKENTIVSQGGIKLNGDLIEASKAKTRAYDIDALILTDQIKKSAKAGRFTSALRTWEQLKKDFPHSEAYKASLVWIPKILKAHQSQLKRELSTLDSRLAKREKVLKSLDEKDRRATKKILKQKQIRYEALVKKEKEQLKTQWISIDPFDKKSLDSSLRNTQSALNNLTHSNSGNITLANADFQSAWNALDQGDLDLAKQHLQKLKQLRIPEKYIQPIDNEINEKKAALEAEKKAAEEAEAKKAEEKEAQDAEKKPSQKDHKK
jgi:hypothetical protein